ncbi:short transient receptor potential channel 5-like, partial [Glandiceps talaboti]
MATNLDVSIYSSALKDKNNTNHILQSDEMKLVRAVKEGDVEEVKNLLQTTKLDVNIAVEDANLTVTPLQLAAEQNDFRLTKLLVDRGAKRLVKPKLPTDYDEDLSVALARLRVYSALSSPAYLTLIFDDPVYAAFQTSEELRRLSNSKGVYDICKAQYRSLEDQVKALVVDLLENCQSGEEVKILLGGRENQTSTLNNAMKAIDTEQKMFIAHPKCQHVIRSEWLRGQPKWSEKNGIHWTLLYFVYCCVVYVALQPILVLFYVIAPCSPLSAIIDTPKSRFLMYLASYTSFLVIFLCFGVLQYLAPHLNLNYVYFFYALLVWQVTMLWREFQQRMFHGFSRYSADVWNILDLMITCSLLTILVAYLTCAKLGINIGHTKEWTVIINLSAFILVLAFLRYMQNFYLNTTFGPMLLTFTSMKSDIYRFLFLFGYIVCSFAFGFLYLFIDASNGFSGIQSSVKQLLFSIFGRESTSALAATVLVAVPVGSDYSATNDKNETQTQFFTDGNTTYVIMNYGYIFTTMGLTLYALFCILVMLVLLNLCIAMMSDTYTKIMENIDVEWKFVRTGIWLEFFSGPVLSPPFNVIPTAYCFLRA